MCIRDRVGVAQKAGQAAHAEGRIGNDRNGAEHAHRRIHQSIHKTGGRIGDGGEKGGLQAAIAQPLIDLVEPHLGPVLIPKGLDPVSYTHLRLETLRAGAYELNFQMLNVEDLAREAAWEVGALFPGKKIQIKGQAPARCDGYWMGEALMNLLKNACEHTGEDGQIVVEIQRNDGAVLIQVSDNGGGVEAVSYTHLI